MKRLDHDGPVAVPLGQAARMLGLSGDTLRRWHAQGRLICVRTRTNRLLVPTSEIQRILKGR